MSMKPKAALVKAGILPKGAENKRGRLSAALIAECERLVRDEGYSIDGFSVSSTPAPAGEAAKPAKVERVSVDPNRVVDVPDALRDERDFIATVMVDGKARTIGARTVCNGCHSSLPYCACPTPRVWIDHITEGVVSFKSRPEGTYKKGW